MMIFEPIKLAIFQFLNDRGLNNEGFCNLRKWRKADNTIVTELDVFISEYLKKYFKDQSSFAHYNFYSEEDFSTLTFPSIILDPIDGTEGLVLGTAESVISLAIMECQNIEEAHGIIYNPFTGLEVNTFCKNDFVFRHKTVHPSLIGLVSRHEWKKGHFTPFLSHPRFRLVEKGSIALKLAFLTLGMCDFILSYRPKKIWDIAAGTILARRSGYNLYSNGKCITDFNTEIIPGPLLWCHESNFLELSQYYLSK